MIERRTFNSTKPADITDLNIGQRISHFQDMLKSEYVYIVPLRYSCDNGKINSPPQIDFKVKCHLETDMKNLFESKKRVTSIDAPDAKIIFTKASSLQYEQFLLDKIFRQYLGTIMVSKKILMMGLQKTPTQKTYKISTRFDSRNIDSLGSN